MEKEKKERNGLLHFSNRWPFGACWHMQLKLEVPIPGILSYNKSDYLNIEVKNILLYITILMSGNHLIIIITISVNTCLVTLVHTVHTVTIGCRGAENRKIVK